MENIAKSSGYFFVGNSSRLSINYKVMKYGIIKKNITDLCAKPDYRSERKSQLLYNEPVRIDKSQNGYYRVIQPDGYFGWVSENAVRTISGVRLKKYLATLKYRVKSKTAKIYISNDKNSSLPDFLFYGTKVSTSRTRGNYRILRNSEGNSFKISKNNLELLKRHKVPKPIVIIKEAKKFLGVPYLWGGTSPFGFDCSGFVRTIFGKFGIELPRDSRDQFKFGREVTSGNIRPADLLFFKGHVALVMSKDKFIHSSLGAGGVAINSLNSDDVGFRKDLFDIYLGARRVLP